MILKVAITLSLSALTLYYLYRYYVRERAKLTAMINAKLEQEHEDFKAKLEQDRIEFAAMLAASREAVSAKLEQDREAYITDLTTKVDATIEEIRKGRRS